ncbi:MAG TPA: hypothetical protein VFD82_16910 [Planctomycetota bacterium]|nr:hypothetical protein [Planctomycetota bacterium]
MRRLVATLTLFGCIWAMPCNAQQTDPKNEKDRAAARAAVQRAAERRAKEEACPFEAPRLSSTDPAEVAWAAARLTAEDSRKPEVAAALIAALRSFRVGEKEEHRRAVLHLLHAALQNDVVVPMADLRFEPEGRTRVPWVALQTRNATNEGGEVFGLFHGLDEKTDAGWEFVGGSLAIRGHGAFAIELRTQMVPRLHVVAGPRPGVAADLVMRDAPGPLTGFPVPPAYYWQRDKSGFVGTAFVTGPTSTRDCSIDAARLDRVKLRWLAQLVEEPDPAAWAARFEARFPERGMGKFQAFSDASEKRAAESLAAMDLALRKRFKIPERLALPKLEIVWEDFRREDVKKAQPMPERR